MAPRSSGFAFAAVVFFALMLGCGGAIDGDDEGAAAAEPDAPRMQSVTGRLSLRTGDAMTSDRPQTHPLPSARVFLVPLVRCKQVGSATVDELEGLGIHPVASAVSKEDGSFDLRVPAGSYTIFVDFEGRPRPLSASLRNECNRVDVGSEDVVIPWGRTTIDLSA